MTTQKMNIDRPTYENGFLFERPHLPEGTPEGTELAVAMGAIASRRAVEQRTRVVHPDGRRENVSEHGDMLVTVATAFYRKYYDRLPESCSEGMIALYANLHDDIEAYVGDTPTDFITADGLVSKQDLETQGMEQMIKEYESLDPVYVERLRAYEEQIDPNARFVRLVDKFMTLLVHIPNGGLMIRENYPSREEFMRSVQAHHERLHAQFPEMGWLVELRRELAVYLGDVSYGKDASATSHR